jgi:GNAT superfamily N-acetyltransferase
VALDAASGAAVGAARYIRTTDPDTAEVAVAVVDDWQSKGVGTALLELMAAPAREEGVSRHRPNARDERRCSRPNEAAWTRTDRAARRRDRRGGGGAADGGAGLQAQGRPPPVRR